ncbi:MAG TPA: MBL fold metallo-hydrolase [Candidatus Paceibacterota bacterium]|nr:MBL fold metallo-hydrolase [Candidatus Paceibacterota bacterium]
MKLTFYGGVGEVTGSNYVLESGGQKIMIDCGLHQGGHYAEKRNFEPFPFDAKEISAVFITHPHLDHLGRTPNLPGAGFRGTIYSTPPAKDCGELLLLDSEHILAKEAEREKKAPLYNVADVNHVMSIWKKLDYHTPLQVGNFKVELFDAGHVLGSAFVRVEVEGKVIVFSGDLGNFPAPIIKPTEMLDYADYCLVESTYGNRIHENVGERREMVEDAIEDTVRAKGTLLIPTFAMERTQELLYHLHQLFEEGRVPRVPVFIDSPLAIKLTAVYKKYENDFNKETRDIAMSGDDIMNFPGLRLTLTTEQSKEINGVPPPKVVIAGSGMSQGGRILHHEARYLPDPKSTILFVGYQAEGSLGRQIMDGAPVVRIFGEEVPVRCKKKDIPGYSAHADQPRLLEWVGAMRHSLKKVFVVQGEPDASEALAAKIRDELAVLAVVPKTGETVEL